jgi:hypothetical protein
LVSDVWRSRCSSTASSPDQLHRSAVWRRKDLVVVFLRLFWKS